MGSTKTALRPLTYAEIDLSAIRHNFREIKRVAGPGSAILAVVKADAYGHGMIPVARLLTGCGVNILGVSDVAEGIELRKAGIKKPVLLFESTLPSLAADIIRHRLTPTVCTWKMAEALNRIAGRTRNKINIHIKVDTGMRRLGIWHEELDPFIRKIQQLTHLTIEGMYTHFPLADTDRSFTLRQIKTFEKLVERLRQEGMSIPYIHAANSMGLSGYRHPVFNLSRPGLMLYGLYPSQELRKHIRLKPALAVKSKVIFIKEIPRGSGISYGHTFVAARPMRIATLPIGYSDGYLRCFSNSSAVLIQGRRCPVVGNVTMDQIMIDLRDLSSVRLGSEAIILGSSGRSSVSADELATKAGTIHYEIVCNLGNRLPRVYKNK